MAVVLSALTEAWQEVKIQKVRVILSLIGVVAAVAAMSTVIALSKIMTQAFQEEMEAISGRDTTITLNITERTSEDGYGYSMMGGPGGIAVVSDGAAQDDAQSSGATGTASDLTNAPLSEETLAAFEKVGWNANDIKPSVFSRATQILVSRFSLSHYSRVTTNSVVIPEVTKAVTEGHFQGREVVPEGSALEMMGEMSSSDMSVMVYIQAKAVDTSYNTIYRLRMDSGRWLSSGDVNQQVTPVVINSIFWSYLGYTPLDEGITLTLSSGEKIRVVGVVQSKNPLEEPTMYMLYDAWELAGGANTQDYSDNVLLVWVDPSQAEEARVALSQTLSSLLGDKYEVSADIGMMGYMGMNDEKSNGTQTLVLIIGAIVILLGILGLVNVAIVTVRQRIREIGIRRAVGASAKRIFFAVFLESVVATFIAGLIGVMLSILIVRNVPLKTMGIYLQDTPGFPMSTAVTALLIATGIGALAGIIPALTALKVKPIDAIRY